MPAAAKTEGLTVGTKGPLRRNAEMEADARWHLDKRIPIAIILAIAVQSGAGIWWAASVDGRVTSLERQVQTSAPDRERLTRVEVRLEGVQSGISEIKTLLQAASKPKP